MSKPIFNWLENKAAGLLLHPTSLPGKYGIGTLGKEAFELVDFIEESGLKYWQVCPLGPTGFGDSPYQCFSAFAGNPYLIDIELLIEDKLLSEYDAKILKRLPSNITDYGKLYGTKWPVLHKAYQNFTKRKKNQVADYGAYASFIKSNSSWLDAYSLFMALKEHHNGGSWDVWPEDQSSFDKAKTSAIAKKLKAKVDAQKFFQYLFFGQWNNLKQYSNAKDISIIGDIPIFVAFDSADIWMNPEIFQLGKKGKPEYVAGVPPDYFSEDGQLWGNPLYNWDQLRKSKYLWWIERFKINFDLYDVIRIDHFRAFEDYWQIPASAETAKKGQWMPGPKLDFFKALAIHFPDAQIIAEDLGLITDDVRKLRDDTGLPGMAILHFAFGSGDDNFYLPHNVIENSVIYTGTHDNDTTIGWYNSANEATQHDARYYLGVDGEDIAWDMIRSCLSSKSKLAVIPMQDLMELDEKSRFNEPGTAMGNWQWRYSNSQLAKLKKLKSTYLKELIIQSDR